MVISALAGTGGIGKTALALHWAHANLHRFPGGQLFLDLQGFSPTATSVQPAEAVRGFLDAFGIEPDRIPADLHARTGLYRSLVASKRMLIVLDNAASIEQVEPLLPGSPSCTVLVTSRRRMAGLATGYGARLVDLDVMSESDARVLLLGRLGPEQVATYPAAVADLLAVCAGLPLALQIVASEPITTLISPWRPWPRNSTTPWPGWMDSTPGMCTPTSARCCLGQPSTSAPRRLTCSDCWGSRQAATSACTRPRLSPHSQQDRYEQYCGSWKVPP